MITDELTTTDDEIEIIEVVATGKADDCVCYPGCCDECPPDCC
jgi:hypothetical protein